jgi:hypothetical protein
MWVIWGSDASGLSWTDSRWREFVDGDYNLHLGELPPVPFRIEGGRAYLDDGRPLQLGA